MSYGEQLSQFIGTKLKAAGLTSLGKVNGKILSEWTDEFHDAWESAAKVKKKARTQVKTKGDAGLIPPPEDMARTRYKAMGYTFDFMKWWGCYNQNGWMVGKVRMKNWQASMVYWQGSDPKRPPSGASPAPTQSGIAEPPGWREKVKDHPELGIWYGREWANIQPFYQRQIVKECAS